MIFLQAAIGYGLLIVAIFGGAIFIGIPMVYSIVFNYLRNGRTLTDNSEKINMRLRSLIIAIIFIAIILGLIWLFWLSRIDLTYS